MQQYVKSVKIVPELDLSKFQNQWNDVIKDIGKINDDLRKPFDELQKDFSIDISKTTIDNLIENTESNVVFNKETNNVENNTKNNVENIEKKLTKTTNEIERLSTIVNSVENKQINITESKKTISKEERELYFKKIDKDLYEDNYPKQQKLIPVNSFFKGLQKELSSKAAIKYNREEEQDKSFEKLNFLREKMDKLQQFIDSSNEKLTQLKDYDLYSKKEQYSNNKSEIYSLELKNDGDIQAQKKLEKLIKENESLKDEIKDLSKEEYDFTEIEDTLKDIDLLTEKYNELMEKYTEEDLNRQLKEMDDGDNGGDGGGPDWENIGAKIGSFISQKLEQALTSLIDTFLSSLKNLAKNSLAEFEEMSKYSLSTTLTVDSDIRDQALQYGLSDSENYAFSKAKESMNITSEEDLYRMTPAQQDRFAELIGKYTSQYQEIADKDLFSKYEEYQKEIEDFQNELQMEIITFFAENKDTIIAVMDFLMDALSGILDAITWINKTLGRDEETSAEKNASVTSDIISSYSISNSKTTNVKIDNSFSNISPKEQSAFIKAGERVNEQLIKVLEG